MVNKILWINDKPNFLGGAEHYIYNTVKLLKERGIKSTLLYDVNQFTDDKYLKIFDYAFPLIDIKLQIKDIDADIIYIHQLASLKHLKEITKLKEIKSFKFIHDHKLFCLREHKYKTISKDSCNQTIGLNCYSCLGFINRSDNLFKIKFSRVGNLKTIQDINKKLDGFIVASKYMKNHMISHGFNSEKIYINNLYVKEQEEIFLNPPNSKRFLFVGQLVRGKGIDLILKAISMIEDKEIKVDIIGSGFQEDEYKKLSKTLKIEQQIKFHKQLSQDEIKIFYKNSIALLMPSRAPETFGLSAIEALSFNIPVIAPNIGGMGEWIEDEKTAITFQSNSAESLKNAILKIVNNRYLQQNMRNEINKIFIDKFLPKYHIDKLLSFFS